MVATLVSVGHAACAEESGRKILVNLDEAKVIGLPRGAHQIILGNPLIVSVTPLPNAAAAVLTGKAFGETNLVILDDHGGIVVDATIRVALPANGDVVLQRNGERATYACRADCGLRLQLGDGGEVEQGVAAQARTRNGLATSQAPQSMAPPSTAPQSTGQAPKGGEAAL